MCSFHHEKKIAFKYCKILCTFDEFKKLEPRAGPGCYKNKQDRLACRKRRLKSDQNPSQWSGPSANRATELCAPGG